MKWKRCTECHDLKPLDHFWKKGTGYRSQCKKCLSKKINKEKKKEYDHKRYLKLKEEKEKNKDVEYVCMRCEEYVANVRNNSMYWCFHCLKKYEEEWKTKIKVEIINPVFKRSKVKITSMSFENNSIEDLIEQFVSKLENKSILDEELKNDILKKTNVWNKSEIMNDLIEKVLVFKSYDDKKGTQFPYKQYVTKFLED